MISAPPLPPHADVIVVGGGSAGATVAGTIVERSSARVLLLEAGPDYGPKTSGRWPEGLLDPSIMTFSHDWGYRGSDQGRQVNFPRARVLGGCSAINGAAVVHGSRTDYQGWVAAGNDGWSAEELEPLFASAWEHLTVTRVGRSDLTPFQALCLDAIAAAGIPAVEDLNDLDETCGVAPFPTNTDAGGVRVNAGFGYLDPHRDCGRLTVAGDCPVQRLLVQDGRVTGVVVDRDGGEVTVSADRVAVCAGAYGSPALLLRSGIGPREHLEEIGVSVVHDLPGVGENLQDQPAIHVDYAGTAELAQLQRSYAHTGRRRDEQVVAKLRSSGCTSGFDLHIFPIGGPRDDPDAAGRDVAFTIAGAVLTPLSRGQVRLSGPTLDDDLVIDHRYLSDPEGRDLSRLAEVVGRIRRVAEQSPLRTLLGRENYPGAQLDGDGLTELLKSTVVHYYHPAGSCKMGPGSDPAAVVDRHGQVHGVQQLFVADASVMPTVVSGNTNMPTIVIGEKLGRHLAQPG